MRYLVLLLALLLSSCTSQTPQLAMMDKGFGGTGLAPCPQVRAYVPGDSGFGGTGNTSDCGFGGTGVIGTITDFGSIWVNGLEIELAPDTRVDSNLGHTVSLEIGQQVITHTASDALETDHVRVFYPVAGRVESTDGHILSIAGEQIHIDRATRGLKAIKPGDYVAVNAWPRPDGSWLATRIDPNPSRIEQVDRPTLNALQTRRALLEGTVIHRDGEIILAPYDLPLTAEEARQIENGALALVLAQRIRERWEIRQIRALRQWHVDWQQLQQHQHTMRDTLRDHRERQEQLKQLQDQRELQLELNEYREDSQDSRDQLEALDDLRDQQESLESLKEQQEELKEQREQAESVREQQEALEELKEQQEAIKELQEQQEEIQEQQDSLEELREQREQLEELREAYEEKDDD